MWQHLVRLFKAVYRGVPVGEIDRAAVRPVAWTLRYQVFLHEPRPKPRSWSDKYYRLSKWSRERISVSQHDPNITAADILKAVSGHNP